MMPLPPTPSTGTIGSFTIDGSGNWSFTANSAFDNLNVGDNVSETFNVTSVDGTASTVTLQITGSNDAPMAVNDSLAATEDTPVTYTAANLLGNDSDVDGPPSLTIASVTSATGGTTVLNGDGTVTFTPNADFNGNANFTYTVTDGTLTSNTATVTVGVTAVNDTPVAVNDSLAATENTPVTYTASDLLGNDSDVDGPSLSIASVTSGTGGTAVLNGDGTVTFTPNADFNGNANFTYTVTDGTLTSNTATVTVGVTPVNDLPLPGGGDPDPDPDPDPEPDPGPDDILPIDEELPPPEETDLPPDPIPDGSGSSPAQRTGPGYYDPKISLVASDDMFAIKNESPSAESRVLKYLRQELAARMKVKFAPVATAFFSTEDMAMELDRIQQQIEDHLNLDIRQNKLFVGAATGMGVSVFVGYVVWIFRGGSLLVGALSAMPMWRCFDPLPVIMGKDRKQKQEDDQKRRELELDDDEKRLKDVLGTKSTLNDQQGPRRRED